LCYFNLVFISESFCHLFNENNRSCSNLLQSSYKPLDKLLVNKQVLKRQNLILCQKNIVPLHHCIVRENVNKSHHLLYLWKQQKTRPKPSLTVIMATRKNWTHPHHLLYLWQHQKTSNYWIPFNVDVINDCHNNQGLWKEGNKNFFFLKVFEMMPCGALKFQIAFWAFRPTSIKRFFFKKACNKTIKLFVGLHY